MTKRELNVLAKSRLLPDIVRAAAVEAVTDASMNRGVVAMMERAESFTSPLTAMLAGIAADRLARRHVDDAMTTHFALDPVDTKVDEVVVGAGLHAAIYCAVRVKMGGKRPLVIDVNDRVGGIFACSRGPSFFLNSRNRSGPLSVPGEEGALNYIPAGVLQPSDMSAAVWQPNDDMGWLIRLHLALFAQVLPSTRVVEVVNGSDGCVVRVENDTPSIAAKRVIVASGVGEPADTSVPRVLTFPQFMARMDDPFPMRDMRRVAVLGAGDSGKVTIEALCGLGPAGHMSVASLDRPQVDWYGQATSTCSSWELENRSRYKAIGKLIDPGSVRAPRVRCFADKGMAEGSFESVYVNGTAYDYVIDCTGFSGQVSIVDDALTSAAFEPEVVRSTGGRALGRRMNQAVWTVGPAARLLAEGSKELSGQAAIPENATAIFRYADRTAALAMALGTPASKDSGRITRQRTNGGGTVLVRDAYGKPISYGDRVRAKIGGSFTGIVQAPADGDSKLARGMLSVLRDDGVAGGGYADAKTMRKGWKIGAGRVRLLQSPAKESLGFYDSIGEKPAPDFDTPF
jgi:hypothetical protein